jgi:hypothetical protein
MKSPELASQACNFVFDKDTHRNQEEALKHFKRKEIARKKSVIQHKRSTSNNPFLPHRMSKLKNFTSKSRGSSPFMIKTTRNRSGSMTKTGNKFFNFGGTDIERKGNRMHLRKSFSKGKLSSKL